LEDDQSSGRFALLDKNRFPPGIEKLRHPLDMDEKESEQWHQHIARGQIGELSADDTFQFTQPRPGQFERMLRMTIHPDAHLHYPPESLGYLTYLEKAQALRMIQRSDELPLLDPSAIYKSLTIPTESHLRSQLANDEVGLELLDRLSCHDLAGPHHVRGLIHHRQRIDTNLSSCLLACGESDRAVARTSRVNCQRRLL
jgi:hypothetical protein